MILVVGSSGDLGSGLKKYNFASNYCFASRSPRLQDRFFDFSIPETYEESLRDATYCILSAGISNIDECFFNAESTNAINVIRTIQFLSVCKAKKIVPILLSTEQVYGVGDTIVTEDHIPIPKSVYAKQKFTVERYLEKNFTQYLILRLSRIEYSEKRKTSLISSIIEKFMSGESLVANDQFINLLHIQDLSYILNKLIDKNANGIFNIAHPEMIRRDILANKILKIIKKIRGEDIIEELQYCSLEKFNLLEPRTTNIIMSTAKVDSYIKNYKYKKIDEILESYNYELF